MWLHLLKILSTQGNAGVIKTAGACFVEFIKYSSLLEACKKGV